MDASKKFKTVDEYISTFPKDTKEMLLQIRQTVKEAAPDAEEVISYNMPAIKQHSVLVYYAGYKAHIGFYPTAMGIEAFTKELSAFKGSKGAVQFALDEPLPLKLISKIVKFRVKADKEKNSEKKVKVKSKI
jgi:uncharacterized protein YdhG (YjbR/CyaY superfamily)